MRGTTNPAPSPRNLLVCTTVALAFVAAGCRSSSTAGAQRLPAPAPQVTAASAGRLIWPRKLEPGDTIAFVAPAGELDRERMALARTRLEARGYRVIARDDLFAREGYLAGSDERRAEELMDAFRDPRVAAIFPGTGGYGTMRILDRLDYTYIRSHPKVLIGFSDITGLHAALNRRAGLVTFHSPSPMWGLGSPQGLEPLAERWFFRAIERGGEEPWSLDAAGIAAATNPSPSGNGEDAGPPTVPLTAWGRGTARGRLVGGNLSLVSALEGTPYAIDTRDAILLLEDVREAPYRIDRMLRQLKLAGKLGQLRGAVLGQFTRSLDREDAPRDQDPRYTIDGVLRQYFGDAGIPVLVSFPIGHVRQNLTLPLGGLVEIDADRVSLTVLDGEGGDWLPGAAAPSPPLAWRETTITVRPGLRLSELAAGGATATPRFQVIIGEHDDQADADAALARLEAAGYSGRVGYGTSRPGAYAIQLPDFASRAAADAALTALRTAGFAGHVVEVGQDLTSPGGPWSARLLEVDPRLFRVEVEHAADAAIGVETTVSLAQRRRAVAAINGGYYVTKGLLKGDSTGLLKIDGRLLSEPDRGRAAVGFVDREGAVRPIFGRLVLDAAARLADGTSLPLDGLNRARGAGEAVAYTPEFHRTTLTDQAGLEVVVADGRIVERQAGRGGAPIPAAGWVLSLGAERALLDGERLRVGEPIELTLHLCPFSPQEEDCAAVDAAWAEALDALAAGPLLLGGGVPVEDAASEAFSRVFALARHPRTALGVRADGTLLLLTVDGRHPERSVGMSLGELTALLRELGAVEAINLDGGGSTTMVVEGRTVNRPSDPGGERENADALLVFPRD
jgi:muramoyltetrapeptide carboxypeptidase